MDTLFVACIASIVIVSVLALAAAVVCAYLAIAPTKRDANEQERSLPHKRFR